MPANDFDVGASHPSDWVLYLLLGSHFGILVRRLQTSIEKGFWHFVKVATDAHLFDSIRLKRSCRSYVFLSNSGGRVSCEFAFIRYTDARNVDELGQFASFKILRYFENIDFKFKFNVESDVE